MHKLNNSNATHPLSKLGSVPFSHGVLLPYLAGYKRPNDKIARWIACGDVVQLQRGLYVLGQPWRLAPVSLPLVANMLFGPSYVSREFALSAHGLIPESVPVPTSVTTRRGRQVTTPLGMFSYAHLPLPLYGVDLRIELNPEGTAFLMASPTQALCDLVVLTKHLQASSKKAMRLFLLEDMRIEPDAIAQLNKNVITQCLLAGRKARQLHTLLQCVEDMT